MFPFPYLRDLTDPSPIQQKMLDDLGLSEEQLAQLGPLRDAQAMIPRWSFFAMVRRFVGNGLVRLGELIQGCPDPEATSSGVGSLGQLRLDCDDT